MKIFDLTIGLSVILLLAVLATDNVAVRAVLSTPLVFFLTGHVVLRAVRPLNTGTLENIVYSVGLSIAVCVLGGFLLNKLSLLTSVGWASYLLVVNIVASIVALRHPYEKFAMPTLPRVRVWQIASIGAAVAITIGAFALANSNIESFKEFDYTELWLVPTAKPGKLLIGINNVEQEPAEYDLIITAGKTMIASWPSIQLNPGDKPWVKEVVVGSNEEKAEAILYRSSDHALYRRVSAFVPGHKK